MSDYICNACGMKCGGTCYQPAKETSATSELKDKKIKQLEARVKELESELKELHRAQRNVKVNRIEREEFSVKFYTGSCSSAGALARLFGYKAGE